MRHLPYGPRNRAMQAFTILEVLIAGSVMVIFFGLVFSFLVPGMRIYAIGSTRAEMQQEVLRVIDKIAFDFEQSVTAGISLSVPAVNPENGPVYMGVMRLDSIDSSGNQVWQNNLAVYSWEGKGKPVVKKEWRAGLMPALGLTFGTATKFDSTVLSGIALEPALRGKILARDVELFSVTTDPDAALAANISPPFVITVKIKRKAATGRPVDEEFSLSRSMSIGNQL